MAEDHIMDEFIMLPEQNRFTPVTNSLYEDELPTNSAAHCHSEDEIIHPELDEFINFDNCN